MIASTCQVKLGPIRHRREHAARLRARQHVPQITPKRHNIESPRTAISLVAADASMTTRRLPLMDISNNDATSSPVATASRRKSGRAVKVPEKFVPEAPSSQAGSGNAKRKRGKGDVENDASEVEEEAEESDDNEESAAEEEEREVKKKAPRPRKPAAKKPKVNGDVAHERSQAVRLPARPKKGGTKVAIADKDAEGLYGKRASS